VPTPKKASASRSGAWREEPDRRPTGSAASRSVAALFFTPDEFLDVPASFNPQNLSGSRIDLETTEGKELWSACLKRAESDQETPGRLPDTANYSRYGKPQLILPRIGQAAFRLAVLDAYAGKCAMTGESSAPAIEATHIRPWSRGGDHKRQNGLPLRRDLHRLFDLGYIAITPGRTLTVSPKLRAEFGGRGRLLRP
jgi:putative restriction endonuclease